ncbi:RidA family protein [Sulfitobacter aestuariivivens]|uniref:RidA family protein n=1 Tax=Sulfitobacter aestuariivivens TaxID=2766981 RepID=A0A927HF04_9RHOB|nr:RidA family protein [Sulfitobacter aestuariivivens]MBD3665347.1 RidA family protein [Sulfitobacter aestuariivivens]
MKALTPTALRAPFGNYAHGVEIPAGARIVQTSGQLGIRTDDSIPPEAQTQAEICFASITEILRVAGMTPDNVFHIAAYVTDRAHMPGYMAARDAFVGQRQHLPSSTLVIVSGFTRLEFKVEVEVMAAASD